MLTATVTRNHVRTDTNIGKTDSVVMQVSYGIATCLKLSSGSDPNGIRTRVTAVKGRCPGPLDDRVAKAGQYRIAAVPRKANCQRNRVRLLTFAVASIEARRSMPRHGPSRCGAGLTLHARSGRAAGGLDRRAGAYLGLVQESRRR